MIIAITNFVVCILFLVSFILHLNWMKRIEEKIDTTRAYAAAAVGILLGRLEDKTNETTDKDQEQVQSNEEEK